MVVHLLGDLGHPVHHPDRGGEARQLGGPRDLPTVALPAVQSGQFAGDLVRVQQRSHAYTLGDQLRAATVLRVKTR